MNKFIHFQWSVDCESNAPSDHTDAICRQEPKQHSIWLA